MFNFNWFGHQSLFDVPPPAVCLNGHFASVDMCFLLGLLTTQRLAAAHITDASNTSVRRYGPSQTYIGVHRTPHSLKDPESRYVHHDAGI
jgi:hypothetical protein